MSTPFLMIITLGPVQEFIAQARRTRDLWYGSHLLSELSRFTAKCLLQCNAELIYPAFGPDSPELERCPAGIKQGGTYSTNVANKIVAILPPDTSPESLAVDIRKKLMEFWARDVAGPVKIDCAGLLAEGIDQVWNEQIDSFLEFAAAWRPLSEFCADRIALEQSISARKSLRDFKQWESVRGCVNKSSLDGARETVLRPANRRDPRLVKDFRIAPGEELDAVGLVKRAGTTPNQFVPLVNVALASWAKLGCESLPSEFDRLKTACRNIGIPEIRRRIPCTESFGFDGSVFLENRLVPLFSELAILDEIPSAWYRKNIIPIVKVMGQPFPYVACLAADGDNIGNTLNDMKTPAEMRKFSEKLSRFSGEARQIVEQDHLGSLVYAGGDDVLAFVPVPEALACAEDLRIRFDQIVRSDAESDTVQSRPTLSVGIGIGHLLESMGDLLSLGREAEALAKGYEQTHSDKPHNALGIIIDKRSGGRRSLRKRWDEPDGCPVRQIQQDILNLNSVLSTTKVFEIRNLMKFLKGVDNTFSSQATNLLVMEIRRVLSRNGECPLTPTDVGLNVSTQQPYDSVRMNVDSWINRMLIAKHFCGGPRPSRWCTKDFSSCDILRFC